jgi:hypothetical protein
MLEGWSINTVVLVTSGLPWGLSDQSNDYSGTNSINTSSGDSVGEMWNFTGKPSDFTPVHGFTDTNGGWQNGGGGLPFFLPGTPDPTDPLGPTDPAFAINNAQCVTASGGAGTLGYASMVNFGCYQTKGSVLVPPAFGSAGNIKPNIWRDTGFKNMDFSITKLFTVKERLKVEARVEIFNILNHINFSNPSGGPGGAIGDPSAGPPNVGFVGLTPDTYSSNPQLGSGGERAMQLGLKLSF